jgi:lysozyme
MTTKLKSERMLSSAGKNLLKQLEGFRSEAYLDEANVATIGYGTTRYSESEPVAIGDVVTELEADELLAKDLQWAQDAINNLVDSELEQHQFDALVVFVYNVGKGAFSSSTILRKLNDPYSLAVEDEFQRWVWAGGQISLGLINRRIKERDLFLGRNIVG